MPIKLRPASEPAVHLLRAASPDGRTIALIASAGVWPYSYQHQNPPALALWLAPSDGGDTRKIRDLLPLCPLDLTPGSADTFDLPPALSSPQALTRGPDVVRIAFVSAHIGAPDLP